MVALASNLSFVHMTVAMLSHTDSVMFCEDNVSDSCNTGNRKSKAVHIILISDCSNVRIVIL